MSNYNERMKAYQEECRQELIGVGFPESITGEQAELILQPSHGPENFYCDGEITHKQALASWKRGLRNLGLTEALIRKAEKHIFG
jgi:hypothetical protein